MDSTASSSSEGAMSTSTLAATMSGMTTMNMGGGGGGATTMDMHHNMGSTSMDMHTMPGMDGMDMDHGDMAMQMYFTLGYRNVILFRGWATDHPWQFALSCLAVMLFAMLFEAGKAWRRQLDQYIKTRIRSQEMGQDLHAQSSSANLTMELTDVKTDSSNDDYDSNDSRKLTFVKGSATDAYNGDALNRGLVKYVKIEAGQPPLAPWGWHLLRALLYFLHYGLGFWLMLIAMTYSTALFFCIIIGGGLGFLIFERRLQDAEASGPHH